MRALPLVAVLVVIAGCHREPPAPACEGSGDAAGIALVGAWIAESPDPDTPLDVALAFDGADVTVTAGGQVTTAPYRTCNVDDYIAVVVVHPDGEVVSRARIDADGRLRIAPLYDVVFRPLEP